MRAIKNLLGEICATLNIHTQFNKEFSIFILI